MTRVIFEQIRKAAETFYRADTSNAVAKEVDYMVDCGTVNASDTLPGVSDTDPEWQRIALDTLEQCCAYAEPHQAEAVQWLISQGLTF
jgi:hypothetical protein